MTVLAMEECIDSWNMKIEWNREVGLVDLQKSNLFENFES